jgi:hypothetical protein
LERQIFPELIFSKAFFSRGTFAKPKKFAENPQETLFFEFSCQDKQKICGDILGKNTDPDFFCTVRLGANRAKIFPIRGSPDSGKPPSIRLLVLMSFRMLVRMLVLPFALDLDVATHQIA